MKYCILMTLLSFSVFADPFYDETTSQGVDLSLRIANNETNLTACQPHNQIAQLPIDVPFEKLRLVGLMKKSDKHKAIFVDDNHTIYDFTENLYLPFSGIEIKNIDLKHVYYIDWKNSQDCEKPLTKIMKL